MISRFLLPSIGVALWLGTALGQSFEVTSVKPNKSGSNSSHTSTTDHGITAENVSLKQLIQRAYGVADYSLSGPVWLGDDKFDIAAKQPDGTPKGQTRTMLQSLLAERFGLAVHFEQKSLSGYALIAGKKPPVLHDKPAGAGTNTNTGRGTIKGTNVSMADLAGLLSRQLDQPVQDQTGLPGVLDISLEWSPDPAQADDRATSLFTALQEQLGLKLQAQKVTVEVLVVDHAERVPTEN
ncbi:MAG: TIGR03435 family protein [Acidobacteriia bacterium]|nr:TIGR03435 family protein [Terriglobia bacterium]